MVAVMLLAVVLGADPTAAEQKIIEKAKVELQAARVKAGGPLVKKTEAAKADLEAIEAGEIDTKLRQTLTRKTVKGKPVYVFRNEVYREKEQERIKQEMQYASRTNDMQVTPPLNLLSLKSGAKGKLAMSVNDRWLARIVENESSEDGINLLVEVNPPSGNAKGFRVRMMVRGAFVIPSDPRLSCVVTGVKKVRGESVYQVLVVEQFDGRGNLIDD